MARPKEKDGRVVFTGGNVKLLAVKVRNELYAALEAQAAEEKLPLPDLVRRYLQFIVFPDLLMAYILRFTEALEKIDLMSPEEVSKFIPLCEKFWDNVLKRFEAVRPIEAKAQSLRETNKRAQKELLKNFTVMMEAWKSSRETDKQAERT